jgi:hypothetical protein
MVSQDLTRHEHFIHHMSVKATTMSHALHVCPINPLISQSINQSIEHHSAYPRAPHAVRARKMSSPVVPSPSGAYTDRVAATQLIVPPDDVWRSNTQKYVDEG